MKRILLLALFFIVFAVNAQININIGSGSVGTAPVSSFFSYSYVQQIYPKQEVNASAAGNITGLSFYLDPSATINDSSNWTVYLGHTSKASFI
jgi:ABC-type phosphate transport system substrate-binding protein